MLLISSGGLTYLKVNRTRAHPAHGRANGYPSCCPSVMLAAVARFPSRIGRYDLITALATGGMGRVYLGRAAGIGGFERKVVIKRLEVALAAASDPAIAVFLDGARGLGQRTPP